MSHNKPAPANHIESVEQSMPDASDIPAEKKKKLKKEDDDGEDYFWFLWMYMCCIVCYLIYTMDIQPQIYSQTPADPRSPGVDCIWSYGLVLCCSPAY